MGGGKNEYRRNLYITVLDITHFRCNRFSDFALAGRRSICQVIATFRDYGAVDYQKALPLELIGLGPRPLFSLRFFRDYKPWALQTLAQAGIIRMASEGNYYLSEETLSANQNFQSVCQAK